MLDIGLSLAAHSLLATALIVANGGGPGAPSTPQSPGTHENPIAITLAEDAPPRSEAVPTPGPNALSPDAAAVTNGAELEALASHDGSAQAADDTADSTRPRATPPPAPDAELSKIPVHAVKPMEEREATDVIANDNTVARGSAAYHAKEGSQSSPGLSGQPSIGIASPNLTSSGSEGTRPFSGPSIGAEEQQSPSEAAVDSFNGGPGGNTKAPIHKPGPIYPLPPHGYVKKAPPVEVPSITLPEVQPEHGTVATQALSSQQAKSNLKGFDAEEQAARQPTSAATGTATNAPALAPSPLVSQTVNQQLTSILTAPPLTTQPKGSPGTPPPLPPLSVEIGALPPEEPTAEPPSQARTAETEAEVEGALSHGTLPAAPDDGDIAPQVKSEQPDESAAVPPPPPKHTPKRVAKRLPSDKTTADNPALEADRKPDQKQDQKQDQQQDSKREPDPKAPGEKPATPAEAPPDANATPVDPASPVKAPETPSLPPSSEPPAPHQVAALTEPGASDAAQRPIPEALPGPKPEEAKHANASAQSSTETSAGEEEGEGSTVIQTRPSTGRALGTAADGTLNDDTSGKKGQELSGTSDNTQQGTGTDVLPPQRGSDVVEFNPNNPDLINAEASPFWEYSLRFQTLLQFELMKPDYDFKATQGRTGKVMLIVTLNAKGAMETVEVESGADRPQLVALAKQAVQRCRKPGKFPAGTEAKQLRLWVEVHF